MLRHNSSINETHLSTIYNFNVAYNKNISDNAFINRLVKLDPNYIKDIDDRFINFYYTLFKIDINNIVTSTDGSNIKLLSCLDKHFKLNKNKYYTNATISCVYDINNNVPLYMDIYKSFNEINNLINQISSGTINKYNYKITNVTDRGYESIKLINYYLDNNISFVSRITKNNSFINNLKNDNSIFTLKLKNKDYQLRIIKYTNIEKPKFKETKDELKIIINEFDKQINLIKNDLINEKSIYNNLCNENKINNGLLKLDIKNKKIKKNNR